MNENEKVNVQLLALIASCGLGVHVHGMHPSSVASPSVPVKSKIESSTITRAVSSASHSVSSSLEEGVWGSASPPPVAPEPRPNGVPTACARTSVTERRAYAMREATLNILEGIGDGKNGQDWL